MGKLVNKARQEQAKRAGQERKRLILEAAGRVFESRPYTQITLDSIGQAAGVPKGTASLYFGSRGTLLFHVLADELSMWCDALDAGLGKATRPLDARALSIALSKSLAGRARLTRLLALAPVALEETVDSAAVGRLNPVLRAKLARLSETLERHSDAIGKGDASRLLRRLLVVVIGFEPLARPQGGSVLLRHEPGFGALRVDFEEELCATVEALLSARD